MDTRRLSPASQLALLPPAEREGFLAQLSPKEAAALEYDWAGMWARPNQLPPPGPWKCWLILAGRGFGKALALETPVPTVTGWTSMGAIQVGDRVFDEQGRACTVVGCSPIYENRPCYDVLFSDGTHIISDAEHEWVTIDRRMRKALRRRTGRASAKPQSQPRYFPQRRTTQDIADSLYECGEVNHAIPCTFPLEGPQTLLPIDPYVLGVWLGDGSQASAELTCAVEDKEILVCIEQAGYQVHGIGTHQGGTPRYVLGGQPSRRDPVTGRMIPNGSLHSVLRQAGLFGKKHIPLPYLRAAPEQRLALLQGLMDTDGYIEPHGNCEFTNTNGRLAEATYELCVSLGLKATLGVGRATLYGKDCGPKYRLSFTPYIPVFRLRRKAQYIRSMGAQSARQLRRYIVDVRPVSSVPVKCITVDSPSHLYLASRSMIPTHNSRAGAEQVLVWAQTPGLRIALVAETAADARDVMVEGDSGLLACSPPWNMPLYQPTKRRVTFANGTICTTYSGDAPEQLRGPSHHHAWCDEVAKWRYAEEAWNNLELGLRLGADPQIVATTTPRPIPLLRQLLADPGTVVTRGSTYENTVNLAATFKDRILSRYEGTRLGRQELYAELLEDTPGALWTRALLEQTRVRTLPALRRIAIGLDPGGDAGIVVAALGDDGHGYVLEDLSLSGSPATWANQAIAGYHKYRANVIVAERNHGGDMVQQTLATQDATVAVKVVWASQGKYARAEPVSALYEKGRVHHVGMFATLEDQLCNWVPGEGLPSPNELDALVWSLTELLLQGEAPLPQVDLSKGLLGMTKAPSFGTRMSGPRPHLGSRRWDDGEEQY